MKKIFISKSFIILICFFLISATQITDDSKNRINWMSVEDVLKKIEKEPRKIFVDTYTKWCTFCKIMDKTTFKNDKVVSYVNENYYAIKLNAEGYNKINIRGTDVTERQLASSFNVREFPTIVLIDEKFETISPMPGYRKAGAFLRLLKQYNK